VYKISHERFAMFWATFQILHCVFVYFVFAFFFVNLSNMVVLCRQVIPSAANETACIPKGVVFIFSTEILYPSQRFLLNFLLLVPSVGKS